jgi:hypothetical protein
VTTATAFTPAETLARLQELLAAATERAAAEARMDRIADEFEDHKVHGWTEGLDHYQSAVYYEIAGALSWHERSDTGLQICQDVQDAIDILKLAIERSDDAR